MALAAAAAHGWRASGAHLRRGAIGWHRAAGGVGPGRDRAWAAEHLAGRTPASAIVRITGAGSDILFGLEAGLHRFIGLAGEPCHVWVQLLEPRAELTDAEWAAHPGPAAAGRRARPPRCARCSWAGDTIVVGDDEVEIPWRELARGWKRPRSRACSPRAGKPRRPSTLWAYKSPIPVVGP